MPVYLKYKQRQKMKNYRVNEIKFSNRTGSEIVNSWDVTADSKRDAVIRIFQRFNDDNFFMDDDGSVTDCDGCVIMDADADYIDFNGYRYEAEMI